MRRSGLVMVAVVAVLIGGCGGGDSDQGSDASGPTGVLRPDGVGAVGVGASRDAVTSAFGEPAQTHQPPPCRTGTGTLHVDQLDYQLSDGTFSINVDTDTERMTAYLTDSRSFATTEGNHVGDDFASLRDAWGHRLRPLPAARPRPTPASGSWVVSEGPRSELLFSIVNGRIATISGGYLPVCR